jgi:hypothetical protein
MRFVLVVSALAVTGCAGMKPIKLFTPSHENRAMVIPGVGGLHRAQYEDSAIGRLQAETLIESHCRGPGAVVADAELQTVSGGGVLLGGVVVPLNSRPAARRASFTREVSFRCGPVEL